MTNIELAKLAAKVLDDKKAEDIMILNISEKSSFADYLILVTGGSQRQVVALVDDVEDAFAKEGIAPKSIEGRNGSGWVLIDYGDVIVNVLSRDVRENYKIEKVWGDCETISLED